MSEKEGVFEVKSGETVVATGSIWADVKEFLHIAINAGVRIAELYGLDTASVTAFVPKGKKTFIPVLRKRPKEGQHAYKAVDRDLVKA